jgi:serine/threonine protein kinase
MDKFKVLRPLGSGASGQVSLVQEKKTGTQYVMKKIPLDLHDDDARRRTEREVSVLSQLDHPNVVQFKLNFNHDDCCHIVMERCEGNLEDLVERCRERRTRAVVVGAVGKSPSSPTSGQGPNHLPPTIIIEWMTELLAAVAFLHSRRIIHRDIKSSNIFLSRKNHLKLGDFGVCKVLSASGMATNTMVGTPYYLAPEVCDGSDYNEKSDIWSLGVVFYELCALRLPFPGDNLLAVVSSIMGGDLAKLPAALDKRFTKIVSQMLQRDPAKRPSAQQLLEKDFVLPQSHPSHPAHKPQAGRAIQGQHGPEIVFLDAVRAAGGGRKPNRASPDRFSANPRKSFDEFDEVDVERSTVRGASPPQPAPQTPSEERAPQAGGPTALLDTDSSTASTDAPPSARPTAANVAATPVVVPTNVVVPAKAAPRRLGDAEVQKRMRFRPGSTSSSNASPAVPAAPAPREDPTRIRKSLTPVPRSPQLLLLAGGGLQMSPEEHHASLSRIRNAKSRVNVAEMRRRMADAPPDDGTGVFLPVGVASASPQRARHSDPTSLLLDDVPASAADRAAERVPVTSAEVSPAKESPARRVPPQKLTSPGKPPVRTPPPPMPSTPPPPPPRGRSVVDDVLLVLRSHAALSLGDVDDVAEALHRFKVERFGHC